MNSTIKVKNENWYENTYLDFTALGVYLCVSVNVPKDLVRFLAKENVHKGDKLYVYSLKKHIKSEYVNKINMRSVHDILLNRCKINVREAKKKLLDKQILEYGKQLSFCC